MTDIKMTWVPISDGSKVRLANAALAAAQAKCDRIDKELAAIAANEPGAKVKLMDLTEQRRVASQRLSELVDTVYDD
jgi:transposase